MLDSQIFLDVYHQLLSPVKVTSLITLAPFLPRYSITALHPIVLMSFSQSTLQDNMSVGILSVLRAFYTVNSQLMSMTCGFMR